MHVWNGHKGNLKCAYKIKKRVSVSVHINIYLCAYMLGTFLELASGVCVCVCVWRWNKMQVHLTPRRHIA